MAGTIAGVVVTLLIICFLVAGFVVARRNNWNISDIWKKRSSRQEPDEHGLDEIPPDDVYQNVHQNEDVATLIQASQLRRRYREKIADCAHIFHEEYGSIRNPEHVTVNTSQQPHNKPKNRYKNILGYDHTLVTLISNPGSTASDYINANYIDGFESPRRYIACQGPLLGTCGDMWKMIWQEEVSIIVMLTKLWEPPSVKPKCEQYWPDLGTTVQYGQFVVQTTTSTVFPDYTVNVLTVHPLSEEDNVRHVTHWWYTAWPDHGIPATSTSLLDFWQQIKQFIPEEAPPVIVHCSAGVGRTGTLIAIDAMLDQIKKTKCLDIYEFVTEMRKSRMYMVQKEEQYTFIHYALIEAITFPNTEIKSYNTIVHMKAMSRTNTETGKTFLEEEFDNICNMPAPIVPSRSEQGKLQYNVKKNRSKDILPFDHNRVKLKSITAGDLTDYINASYIDGHNSSHVFIATQCPLPKTAPDFWRMLWETDSYTVVALDNVDEEYWSNDDIYDTKKYQVQLSSIQERENFTLRKFSLKCQESKERRVISHLQYTSWTSEGVPQNVLTMLQLMGEVLKSQQHTGDGPITVHCSNGTGRTGMFCTIFTTIERLKVDGVIDICKVVRLLRSQRNGMMETYAQYKFCHDAIVEYLASFNEPEYHNFRWSEPTYQNVSGMVKNKSSQV